MNGDHIVAQPTRSLGLSADGGVEYLYFGSEGSSNITCGSVVVFLFSSFVVSKAADFVRGVGSIVGVAQAPWSFSDS